MRRLKDQGYTKEEETEFLRLMKEHDGIIGKLFMKFEDFITREERDDYRQEIFMHAWNDYHKYEKRNDYQFGTWLFHTARWAILEYRRRLWKYQSKTNVVDSGLFEEVPDFTDEGREEHIRALEHAISELPTEDQRVIEMWYNRGQMRQASMSSGKNEHYYNVRVNKIKLKILKNKDRYFEDIFVFEKPKRLGIRNEHHPLSKPIIQYDLNGNEIKRWPSLQEIGRHGYSHKAVWFALKHSIKQQSGGFIWRYLN